MANKKKDDAKKKEVKTNITEALTYVKDNHKDIPKEQKKKLRNVQNTIAKLPFDIMDGRRVLIHKGRVYKLSRRDTTDDMERKLFLLSDCLIITKKDKQGNKCEKHLKLDSIEKVAEGRNQTIIFLTKDRKHGYVFKVSDLSDFEMWKYAISELFSERREKNNAQDPSNKLTEFKTKIQNAAKKLKSSLKRRSSSQYLPVESSDSEMTASSDSDSDANLDSSSVKKKKK